MKKALAYVSAFALIISVSNTAFASGGGIAEPSAATTSAPAAPIAGGEHHEQKEHHAHLHKAHHALENAKGHAKISDATLPQSNTSTPSSKQ